VVAIDLVNVAAGAGGFVIWGEQSGDHSGRSVSSAGDINGDGYDDLLIGAPWADGPGNTRSDAGGVYVVFGQAGGFPASYDLANVASGVGGFVIHGVDNVDWAGWSVDAAGDVNGDGFDDLLIGAYRADGPGNGRANSGDSYVVYGHAGAFPAAIDLVAVAAGNGGFVIHGESANDWSGWRVASAGDVNGDKFDDMIIEARGGDGPGNARPDAGDAYVIFGQQGGFGAAVDLGTIATGVGGFIIHGRDANDAYLRHFVESAGDINGDGFADMTIGAVYADGPSNGRSSGGESYVVFGKGTGFPASIDLAAIASPNPMTPSLGFVVYGEEAGDLAGRVSSAGDVNGDGFDDLLIGARLGSGPSNSRAFCGNSYVVFGGLGLGQPIDLINVANGVGGFVIHGEGANDWSGRAVSSAGDVNGDGFDDLLIGAPYGDGPNNTRANAGDCYVVFGHAGAFSPVDLVSVAAGVGGFVIRGQRTQDLSGYSVAAAGDIDGDGFDDLIIGAYAGDGPANGRSLAGNSYVIFGSATIDGSTNHVTHAGTSANDTLLGDSSANVIIGGQGDDALAGAGGQDVLYGAEGDDALGIADSGFQRVDGGRGVDILTLGGFLAADTMFRKVAHIEGLRLINAATTLQLGPIASRALDGVATNSFLVVIDGALVTNAAVTINAAAFVRPIKAGFTLNAASVTLIGGAGADTLAGGANADTINGGGEDDRLFGRGGADTLSGGAGDDVLSGDGSGDLLQGFGGSDAASYGSASVGVTVDLSQPSNSTWDAAGDSYSSIERFLLSNWADTFVGDLTAQTVSGNGGADTLDGGGGRDQLAGGAGPDTFLFSDVTHSPPGPNSDRIADFSGQGADGDRIDLSVIDAIVGGADDPFAYAGAAAFSGQAGELIFTTNGVNGFLHGDIDGDSAADIRIVLLGVTVAPAAADIVV
jgi:hypothetical protein